MWRKILIPGLALLLAASSGRAQTPARTSVAVYPLKPAGADASLAMALTALLTSKLTPSPKLKVIEEAMLKTVMERQALNVSDACDDTSCQVEIGKLVKAQKMITGNLSKLGGKYILSTNLIDIQSGALEFSTEDHCSCPEDQLDEMAAVAAAKIRNHFGEAEPVPVLPQDARSASTISGGSGPSPRSYLGVEIREVTPELAKSMNLKEAQGVMVVNIGAGSPAEKGGIVKGDVLFEFAGQPLRKVTDLPNLVGNYGAGRPTPVRLRRNGQELTRTVTLEPIPDQFAIFAATDRGDTATVTALLSRQPGLVNARKSTGETPLHEAAGKGDPALARFLLDKGADVNAANQNGWTPLLSAVYAGSKDTVELLISRGASVKTGHRNDNTDRITPLHVAAAKGDRPMVEVLLNHGAEVNAKAGNGATPLHDAAVSGSAAVAEVLLAHGAEVNARTNSGSTPLALALTKKHPEVAQVLRQHGGKKN